MSQIRFDFSNLAPPPREAAATGVREGDSAFADRLQDAAEQAPESVSESAGGTTTEAENAQPSPAESNETTDAASSEAAIEVASQEIEEPEADAADESVPNDSDSEAAAGELPVVTSIVVDNAVAPETTTEGNVDATLDAETIAAAGVTPTGESEGDPDQAPPGSGAFDAGALLDANAAAGDGAEGGQQPSELTDSGLGTVDGEEVVAAEQTLEALTANVDTESLPAQSANAAAAAVFATPSDGAESNESELPPSGRTAAPITDTSATDAEPIEGLSAAEDSPQQQGGSAGEEGVDIEGLETVDPATLPVEGELAAEATDAAELNPAANRAEANAAADRLEASPNQALSRIAAGRLDASNSAESTESPGPRVDAARFVSRVSGAFQAAQERGGEVRLRLSPPELGVLQIKLTVSEGVLNASLETENANARNAILDNLPALRERLAEQEIRIEKFDVDVRDEGRGGDAQDYSPGERRDSDQRSRSTGDAAPEPTATETVVSPTATQTTTDGGINLVA